MFGETRRISRVMNNKTNKLSKCPIRLRITLHSMEKIIQDMQHPETGVPVRVQKIFLSSIPCAFTGYDLIEWQMEKLNIHDSVEALHLANLYCQYGYFFPVTDMRNLVVKDDGSLYRFQTPYFWPSQNANPDNTDYAIYLVKRTLRNKQKHGLEDYELEALNKLKKTLGHKWDFIQMQAEEQVKLAKDRKKPDKLVLDSQEKAFWRVHRPPPGQIYPLEIGPSRSYHPNVRRKKIAEDFKKEVEFLKQAITRPKFKTSKAIDSLISRCEVYNEHDSIISGALPSNPWITEDTTMWILDKVLVETPTERRVKRWAFGLKELLNDATGKHEFEMFLKKEYSYDNLRFYLLCEELKYGSQANIDEKVSSIWKEFLAPGAPCEVNVDGKTLEITQGNLKKPSRYSLEAAQAHIYLLIKKDTYARFIRSEAYKNLLANALQPCSKKKFFNFGGSGGGGGGGGERVSKKKTPTPSPQPKRRGSSTSENAGSVGGSHPSLSGSLNAHHSLSHNNLQDIDSSPDKVAPYRSASPGTLRKKLDTLVKSESPPKSNLEVPKQYPVHSPDTSHQEAKAMSLSVPPMNVVAPWENED